MTGEQVEPKTVEERLEALEGALSTILDLVEDQTKKMAEIDKKTVKKSAGLFGGKRAKTAVKDTKTGTLYPSRARMGKELAGKDEFKDLDPGNNFVYYQIIAKAPERFVDASEEEAKKVWADEAAEKEKERAEVQAKLDAEEDAKKAAGEKTEGDPATKPAKK